MSIDYKVIGERIRNIRIKKNISLLEISKKMNVSIAYISRIEHNNTITNKMIAFFFSFLSSPFNILIIKLIIVKKDIIPAKHNPPATPTDT